LEKMSIFLLNVPLITLRLDILEFVTTLLLTELLTMLQLPALTTVTRRLLMLEFVSRELEFVRLVTVKPLTVRLLELTVARVAIPV